MFLNGDFCEISCLLHETNKYVINSRQPDSGLKHEMYWPETGCWSHLTKDPIRVSIRLHSQAWSWSPRVGNRYFDSIFKTLYVHVFSVISCKMAKEVLINRGISGNEKWRPLFGIGSCAQD